MTPHSDEERQFLIGRVRELRSALHTVEKYLTEPELVRIARKGLMYGPRHDFEEEDAVRMRASL